MPRIKVSKAKLWKAIRRQCLDCVCNSHLEVELCTAPECSLYPYRFGRSPKDVDVIFIPGTGNKYRKKDKTMKYLNNKGWQEVKES